MACKARLTGLLNSVLAMLQTLLLINIYPYDNADLVQKHLSLPKSFAMLVIQYANDSQVTS